MSSSDERRRAGGDRGNGERRTVDLLVHSASQLLTIAGGPQRGRQLGELGLINDGALAVREGRILEVGPSAALRARYRARQELEASGRVVMPGFVDPHTHLIWAGDRAREFEQRVAGASYMELLEAGGGILSTVRETRAADQAALVAQAAARAGRMLEHGTTTAEAKTGYGLNYPTELRMLQAIWALDAQGPLELAPTFLPAHAVPPERTAGTYTDEICDEMLPRLRGERSEGASLPFVDVFCEQGVFDLAQSRRILQTAGELGFPLKIHADEFETLGGARLAAELGAVSADHLVVTPPDELRALAESETVAVALPATPFGLAQPRYTPAHAILEAGGLLAVATDLNPGTAWCESMQFVLALACRYLGLTPAQAIAAATINAAAAIGRQSQVGSLEAGKQADLLVLEVADYRQLGYRFGTNLVQLVVKKGQLVVDRRGDAIL